MNTCHESGKKNCGKIVCGTNHGYKSDVLGKGKKHLNYIVTVVYTVNFVFVARSFGVKLYLVLKFGP